MAKGKVGLGRRGETLAAEALTRHGFNIVTRNWHCREGEVDLVAQRPHPELVEPAWYFIEVRTRRGSRHGSPEESVTPHKRGRMESVARRYLAEETTALDAVWHLSLVAVVMDSAGRLVRVTFYPDLDGQGWALKT